MNRLLQYGYLLRVIKENQKKTILEWNTLIRTALAEVDILIAGESSISSNSQAHTFEEYRKYLMTLANERGFPVEPVVTA